MYVPATLALLRDLSPERLLGLFSLSASTRSRSVTSAISFAKRPLRYDGITDMVYRCFESGRWIEDTERETEKRHEFVGGGCQDLDVGRRFLPVRPRIQK